MSDDRKARALMIVIEHIIGRHGQGHVHLDEKSFELFELAKRIHRAENEADFQAAVTELKCAPEVFKPELLSWVTSVQVAGAERFIAADAFGADNSAGIKFQLSLNFKRLFLGLCLGKTEKNVGPATIAVHRLEKSSRNPDIMAELGPEKRVIKLAHFYELIKAQANGQEGPLLVNGCANIAYIEEKDKSGNLLAVNAYGPCSSASGASTPTPLSARAGGVQVSRFSLASNFSFSPLAGWLLVRRQLIDS